MGHNPWDCPFRGANQPPFRVMLVPSDQQNLSTATNHFQPQDLDYPSYEYFGDRQEHYSEGPYIDRSSCYDYQPYEQATIEDLPIQGDEQL